MSRCPIDNKPCDCRGGCGLADYARSLGASVGASDAAQLRPAETRHATNEASLCEPSCAACRAEDELIEPAPPADEPPPAAAISCCLMRRKVALGILAVLPEEACGVPDSDLADFLRFDLPGPGGQPVLTVRFCPWCGASRQDGDDVRITPAPFTKEPS